MVLSMLARQLSQASSWHRLGRSCAVQSQVRPPQFRLFGATTAVWKRFAIPIKGIPTKGKGRGKRSAGKAAGTKEGDETAEGGEKGEEGEEGKSLKHAMLANKKLLEKIREKEREALDIRTLYPDHLQFEPVKVEKPPVPMLSYGLDRVLFNSGVYRLQDPRSRVYNFDPYLEKIMPANEFDFDALSEYKTSSKDQDLLDLNRRVGTKFTGSTSSMSSVLQHFHYLLSKFRKLNHNMLSRQFPDPSPKFSKTTLGPSAIFLRHKDGLYAIDADKSYDTPNIMSWLGHSLEKLLTTERSEFERFRRSSSEQAPSEDNASRCYHYSRQGNIMMRSQLDAVDPRLPGTGVFDLKTRAVVSIRMNHKEYEEGSGYQLRHDLGEWESFEREFYDMTRSTMLKYSLQVRMGRMDGIFIAFHNIARIFGFQYLSLPDMDAVLHGQHDTCLGDQEFKLSLGLLDDILTKATNQFPNTSLRLHFEAREGKTAFMYVFVEPVTEEQADEIQDAGEAAQKEFARNVIGLENDNPETQASWKEIQDGVDEQIDSDETSDPELELESTEEIPVQDEETPTNVEDAVEDATEDTAEETASSTEDVTGPTTASNGPLLGWTLTVRSMVNGGYVERAENLCEEDDWKIEYHMKEIPATRCWQLYTALKERRRQLVGLRDAEADKSLQHYRDMIRKFSERGRIWRAEQDKIDARKIPLLFRPIGPGSGVAEPYDEVTNEVEPRPEEELYSEETPSNDSLSKEKKEEVLEGLPSAPS
ncbi:mitochondrial membrane pet [Pyrenophora seminiperda CCB06]|uniref:Mitochondrial membrane pet n=1 Tax=Pyrenophora seminiperda CCB06 TaxID=1302712 RepID=A0A3M7MFI3_9PLEO|nr:mitochondrial membrane pet [Pyrenophora seminiperda CCB06]